MKSGFGRCVLCLFLLLSLFATSFVLAQDQETTATPTPKTPLPLSLTPVITLESSVNSKGVEVGNFKIASSNTSQFADAESVDVLAINPSTRGEVELTASPSSAGTFSVSAETLGYDAAESHIISFSMTMVAALDDPDHENGPSLIFCYPVYEACQDPATLVRALPPPTDGTVTLEPEEPEGEKPGARTAGGGTFIMEIPLRGTVIQNARNITWNADNSGNDDEASGQKGLDSAQAQAVDAEADQVTIQFGSDLVGYKSGSSDVVRIRARARAPVSSNQYSDSHNVNYYYCEVPDDPDPDCEALYNDGDDGDGDGGGGDGGGDGGGVENCLNTDAAAPIKVCANEDYTSYTLYGIIDADNSVSLGSVSSSSVLFDSSAAANSNLASGTNSAADQPYTVSYDGAGLMTLSTYYADKGPDVDKPYIITIDTHHTVRYVQW